MSELNFVFGLGFVACVVFVFFLGEYPEVRAVDDRLAKQQTSLTVSNAKRSAAARMANQARMTTNDAGVEILKSYERLSLASWPQGDYWLIGYGHKGKDIRQGTSISAQTAEQYLREDLKIREDFVRTVVRVPLNENEFSALVILNYSIGNSAFRYSTVLRLLNLGNREAAADAFMMWNKVKLGGNLMENALLTKYRQEERDLFLSASQSWNYSDNPLFGFPCQYFG